MTTAPLEQAFFFFAPALSATAPPSAQQPAALSYRVSIPLLPADWQAREDSGLAPSCRGALSFATLAHSCHVLFAAAERTRCQHRYASEDWCQLLRCGSDK
ncbi:hypothetical protein GQ54DRAFT_223113 [Martensiomyces pterosporus]|nr:hypothetical protein GQ54DRAFT_223113 [Martensiomyces pterosporus]